MLRISLKSKFIAGLMMVMLALVQPLTVLGVGEPPTPPEIPTAPTAPEAAFVIPTAPAAPTAPSAPTPPEFPIAPTAPTAPTQSEIAPPAAPEIPTTPTPAEIRTRHRSRDNAVANSTDPNFASLQSPTTGQNSSGQVGSATINSGNANADLVITNNANANLAEVAGCGSCLGGWGASAENTGNGAGSNNSTSSSTDNSTTVGQSNNLGLTNSAGAAVDSGHNNADRNTGGSSTVNSGDANVNLTMVNTGNLNGVNPQVQTVNVADHQVGDVTFAFADPTSSDVVLANNTGNGAGSTNSASNNLTSATTLAQDNSASVTNDVVIDANTGKNSTSRNTGGDNSITTGDVNVVANVINFLNANIAAAANFLIGVVNVSGILDGNIILPRDADLASCGCLGNVSATNSGNGTGSTNTANNNLSNSAVLTQTNDAQIANNLNINATTGDNSASRNTGGSNSIDTGTADVATSVTNIANANVVGDGPTWWLVIVNNLGQWVGHIVGAPAGVTTAGSSLSLSAVNSGNGADSTNSASNSINNSTDITQSNLANLTNNLTINANTGGNNADRNTGGNSTIQTGDVNVIANIVNFINANFIGHRFVVTIVNILGTLNGNIIPPDQPLPVGGTPTGGTAGPAIGAAAETPTTALSTPTTTSHLGAVLGSSGSSSSSNNQGVLLASSNDNPPGGPNEPLLTTTPPPVQLAGSLHKGITLNVTLLILAGLTLLTLTFLGRKFIRREVS